MASITNAIDGTRGIGIDRRRFLKFSIFAGAALGLQSAFPARGHAAVFVPVFGAARDIGVGADGTVWVIGADPTLGGYGIYRLEGGLIWTKVPGGAVRIAVDPQGNAWVTNSLHQIYRFDGGGFQLMPGLARDIGVGADGSVWVIGADPQPGGFGIYRLDGSGNWVNVPGGARRISVDPQGNAWVTNSLRQVYRFNGSDFELMPGLAADIGVGADGSVWAIGANAAPGGYGIYRWNGADWLPVLGGATNVAVDPSGAAWVTNAQQQIYRWV